MASGTDAFDFRLAVHERERAARLLEAMLNRSARLGEDIDREMLDKLRVLVAGCEEARTVALPELVSSAGRETAQRSRSPRSAQWGGR